MDPKHWIEQRESFTSGAAGDLALVGEEAGDTPGESGRARLKGGPDGVCSVGARTPREEGNPIAFFGTVSEDP